jgi:hypothetical protein
VAESSSDFRDTLLELVDASPEPMDHPSSDQWIAYHRGELPADEEARLQEHLVRCRDCFDLAEAAASFAQPEEGPEAGQEVETAALWRLLRPQLEPARRNVRDISSGSRKRPAWWSRLPSTLAASFFVALVGLTVWNLQQRSDLKALRAPQPNAPIFDIAAVERATTGQELAVPAGTRMFVFHPDEELPVYRLTMRDLATGNEQSFDGLRLNQDLALTLYLPQGLRQGRYRLELSDGSGGRAGRVLQTILLRVEEADGGE